MKLALYKSIQYRSVCIHEVDEYMEYMEESDDYIRVSEIIEVEFTELSASTINKQEIVAVDKAINKFMAEAELKLGELKQRKAELLAICDHTAGME